MNFLKSSSKHLFICIIATLLMSKIFAHPGAIAFQSPFVASDTDRINRVKATETIVKTMFADHARKNNFPGFAYGVMLDGKLVYAGATGFTNVQKKTAAGTTSAFRIASMSKSFTAMAIVQLRDAGKLRLDDVAHKYIPELKKVKHLAADAPTITIAHLLTHTAGFPEDNPWGDRQLADSDEDLLKLVRDDVQFSNAPGVAYEYSNLGFALLGRIVTVVAGKPYQVYITENILRPLGMNSTYWEYTKVPTDKLAHGYRWQNGTWSEEALLADGSYGAMGGLITTIEDFEKYMALHSSAWPPSSAKESTVLKRSSLREMQSQGVFSGLNPQFRYPDGRLCPIASVYAYGLRWTKDCDGRTWVGHGGGLPGFGSNWRIFPEYGIGVVCFANLTYASTGGINTAVLDTLVKMANLKPRTVPVSPILQQRKDEIVKLFPEFNGAEKSGIFAENFFPDISIDSVKKKAAGLLEKSGTIIKVGELVAENNLRGSFVMEGAQSNIDVFFTLTPEKVPLIQQLDMRERKK